MAAAGDFQGVDVARPRAVAAAFLGPGGLAHGVGQGFQVVAAGPDRTGVRGQPYDLPAAGRGQPLGVLRAQVVAVGFRVGGERAEDGRGVRVDVRQRRDGGAAASGARTATYRAHDVGRYRTLERAATTLHRLTRSCRRPAIGSDRFDRAALTCGDRNPATARTGGKGTLTGAGRDEFGHQVAHMRQFGGRMRSATRLRSPRGARAGPRAFDRPPTRAGSMAVRPFSED